MQIENRNVKISVIIPCYNGWRHMDKCLASLERQSVAPFEVVVVDDSSTDDSFERLTEYSKKSTLNIILKRNEKNIGPGLTRKKAIEISSGNYLTFCDCDDWYEPSFIECFSDAIQSSHADIVVCDNFVVKSSQKKVDGIAKKLKGKKKKEIIALYKMSLCRCGVIRSLFEGIDYPPIYHGEDGAVITQLLINAEKVQVIEEPLYNYLCRADSASNKPDASAFYEMMEAYSVIKKYLSIEYAEESEFLGIQYICYSATLNGFKTGISRREIRKHVEEFNLAHPNWIKNYYLYSMPRFKRVYLIILRRGWFGVCRIIAMIHSYIVSKR